ncbi:MAG: hypothetical protein M0T72_09190 [Candidatus Dormibacteraeota bacterium]|nr:hypothetical protein [Candidatus Dormibacteraeota bacterium]
MCKVCQRRPEVAADPYGRCESCAKAGRRAYQFRLRLVGSALQVAAGELSPRALNKAAGPALLACSTRPSVRPHLLGSSCELVMAGRRLETIRAAPALSSRLDQVLEALRAGSRRTDASW